MRKGERGDGRLERLERLDEEVGGMVREEGRAMFLVAM
jgi:hypothetical protein